ncbi:TIR-like protein FxsC [Streptacidiphilus neutrinimicus]|uniref:TIR-like protein FxsC n=1 Tax=Streptacidiphilus neutrinimicus TaxID=105420 RepID=UPI001F37CEDB|nr:TIR-like protein FxsC [Streptacidiphilus neutrinimicus]
MAEQEGWDEDIPRPIFFLSYAHSPRGAGRPRSVSNLWEARLFRDLCEAVVDLSGWDANEPPGFMDSGLNVGEGWSERISESLAHCRVFVPLYSVHYFKSQACGQEWAAFASRDVLSVTPGGGLPSAIVPVQWVRVQEERLPPVAKALQFDHQAFGEGYRTEGMQPLLKVNKFQSDYQLAVYRLAQRIVDVSERMRVRIGARRDFQDYDSAFPAPERRRTLRISVAACDVHHLPEGRSAAGYGTWAHEWRPFGGQSEEAIARRAAAVAREWEFHASIEPFAEEAARVLAGERPKAPALLLLDRWTLLDTQRRETLRQVDACNPTWLGLMEPWDPHDPENIARHEELRALSERTLVNLRAQRHQRAKLRGVDVVSSLDEFESMLPHVALSAMHAFEELDEADGGSAAAPEASGSPPRPNLRDEHIKRGNGRPDGSPPTAPTASDHAAADEGPATGSGGGNP